jgi:hypothetical protein
MYLNPVTSLCGTVLCAVYVIFLHTLGHYLKVLKHYTSSYAHVIDVCVETTIFFPFLLQMDLPLGAVIFEAHKRVIR